MFKVQLNRREFIKNIIYHVHNNLGLVAVIKEDADLKKWFKYVLEEHCGLDEVPLSSLTVEFQGKNVIVSGDKEIIDAVGEDFT